MDNNSMDRYLGQLLDNRYEILEVIGRGGMAVVYKARCHLLNRYVAVKILRDDMAADSVFRENFKKEAQAVAMLSHPNIVSIYDVSRTPLVDYIVMELIEGITLKQYMKSKGALSCKETVHFITQIAKALSHAHGKGIVHRDIKPQNIMITLDGAVKVADFGIAYLESAQAAEQAAVGSVHYVSPEQAKGQSVDARSDIYSLGVVMYEMLTGKLPYVGDNAEAIALCHVSSTPVPPREINPQIPEELERIALKAMNADLEQRYQSADELLADLDEYRLSVSGAIPVPQPAEAPIPVPQEPVDTKIPPDVVPISRSGELSKESYLRRHRRANKISLLSGFLLVIIFAVAVFVFLWNYWLKDVFSDAVRINIPNFVGSKYEDIVNNKEFKSIYNFSVTYAVDANTSEGQIISQSPSSGKSVMLDSDGIDVELTVSTGIQMIQVPNVVNMDYREAMLELQKAGFIVDDEYQTSESVTKDFVISTSPEAGDSLPAGATVYMVVSSGPTSITVQVPNLINLTESTAIARIEANNLSVGKITYIESEKPAGTVIWQNVDPYTTVDEHTKIYLQVSTGPKETPPPATEPPATEPEGGGTPEPEAPVV
ncbi:MAG: Stk1 family PASTA domain-containing Ser/Thr kinase [Oscillospiraceae bacterium]